MKDQVEISKGIRVSKQGKYWVTNDLKPINGFELSVLAQDKSRDEYVYLLNYLVKYITTENAIVTAGQTIVYHSWMLKFVGEEAGRLNLFEAKADGDDFAEGVDHTINIVNQQNAECAKFGVTSLFPTFRQMVVISEGVLEGKAIDAVRYASPDHMTGWWLMTDDYDDDIKSLKTIHYYHLAFSRPDILRYLSLPYGFRFYLGAEIDVCFDEEVANEK